MLVSNGKGGYSVATEVRTLPRGFKMVRRGGERVAEGRHRGEVVQAIPAPYRGHVVLAGRVPLAYRDHETGAR